MTRLEKSTLTFHTISQGEMTRRLDSVLHVMKQNDVSVLIIWNSRNLYRTWLTGQNSVYGSRSSGLLWIDEENGIHLCGGAMIPPGTPNSLVKGALPNPKPLFDNIETHFGFAAEEILSRLRPRCSNRIGTYGFSDLPISTEQYISRYFSGCTLIDLTGDLESVRAVRSEAELKAVKKVLSMHERLFDAIPSMIQPLMLESDLVHRIRTAFYKAGSGGDNQWSNVSVELYSGPCGDPEHTETLFYPGRRIRSGDRIDIRIQAIGDDEYVGTQSQSFVLTSEKDTIRRMNACAADLHNFLSAQMRPSVSLASVYSAVNEYIQASGLAPDLSCWLRGIGLDWCEDPCIHADSEERLLMPGMIIAADPLIRFPQLAPFRCCSIYRIRESGAECLSAFRPVVCLEHLDYR